MKYFAAILLILVLILISLKIDVNERSNELPVFLKEDTLAISNNAEIKIKINSMFEPDSATLIAFEKDYKAIWAHLNHLWAYNDVTAGKEYYTENWFKQICKGDNNSWEAPKLLRKDKEHNLHIINWAHDNLVCAAVDSNAVFEYYDKNTRILQKKYNIALVLLYQGDHWRIDALKFLP